MHRILFGEGTEAVFDVGRIGHLFGGVHGIAAVERDVFSKRCGSGYRVDSVVGEEDHALVVHGTGSDEREWFYDTALRRWEMQLAIGLSSSGKPTVYFHHGGFHKTWWALFLH